MRRSARSLPRIIRPMLGAAGASRRATAAFSTGLQANAEKLVRVRPIGEEPRGDDRAAILARVEQRAAQGDIAGALAELASCRPTPRAPVQAWIAKAEARNKALDASRRLAADAVAALKAAP